MYQVIITLIIIIIIIIIMKRFYVHITYLIRTANVMYPLAIGIKSSTVSTVISLSTDPYAITARRRAEFYKH